jgi:DNA invertase Pin-like site-specific DNA recombinase
MKIEYARVSTVEQNLELQSDAMEKAGCEKILTNIASEELSARKI